MINEYLARQLFGGRDPVGQPMPGNPPGVPRTIVVGVVKDAAQTSYDQPAKGELYRPYQQFIFGVFLSTVVARTSGDPLALADVLRREIWAVDAVAAGGEGGNDGRGDPNTPSGVRDSRPGSSPCWGDWRCC